MNNLDTPETDMSFTRHALIRMQQRGIRADVVVDLLDFGRTTHDHRGAEIVFFDKAARQRLVREHGEDAARTRCCTYAGAGTPPSSWAPAATCLPWATAHGGSAAVRATGKKSDEKRSAGPDRALAAALGGTVMGVVRDLGIH